MTQEQKRIKLAEAAGWIEISDWKAAGINGKHPTEPWVEVIPDYFNDLNAVQELQDKLTNDQQFEFVYHLNDVLELVPLSSPASYREVVLFSFANATAAQRFEALGLTLNLW
jgi:hypothetical protein